MAGVSTQSVANTVTVTYYRSLYASAIAITWTLARFFLR